jgi:enamine deaminase RidA (YjgF/YER057c/UK114 family)
MKKTAILPGLALSGLLVFSLAAGSAGAQEIKRIPLPNSDFPILQAVVVPPNASTIYFSGILPEVSNKDAPKGSIEAFGDTETQTVSVFRRIETALASQGLTLGDVIQLKVFLVGDPRKDGKLDFAGFQAGYTKFFATKEQPNKPVRSAFQIAGLALPGALIEIEATAAKVR